MGMILRRNSVVRYPLEGIPSGLIVRDNALFKLYESYTGSFVEVVNTATSVQTILSFGANDFIDETSLLALGSDITISAIKSQSGNGIELKQTVAVRRPMLVSSGVAYKNLKGIIGARKTSGIDRYFNIDNFSLPRNFTQISVWMSTTSPYAGSQAFKSYVDNGAATYGYVNKQNGNIQTVASYGTSLTQVNNLHNGDYTNILVSTVYHDDVNGVVGSLINEDKVIQTGLSTGRRTTPSALASRLAFYQGENWMYFGDILLDGVEYAEVIHKRILKMFNRS